MVAGDQYVALVLPSRIFRREFAPPGPGAQKLSRAAADTGTVTSGPAPWNSCGAYVPAPSASRPRYFPYCFFNLLSPLLDIVYGFVGFKVPTLGGGRGGPQAARAGAPAAPPGQVGGPAA